MNISRYLSPVVAANVLVAIVGKDPFPSNPVDIPFCKATWEEQLAGNCSGLHVLRSLGLNSEVVRFEFESPTNLFNALREHGVVFLNASYSYIGGPLRKRSHLEQIQHAYQLNAPILQVAKTVIYCGEASKIRWVTPIDRPGSYCVVHPDVRNRVNPKTASDWNCWWRPMALAEHIGINISGYSCVSGGC